MSEIDELAAIVARIEQLPDNTLADAYVPLMKVQVALHAIFNQSWQLWCLKYHPYKREEK